MFSFLLTQLLPLLIITVKDHRYDFHSHPSFRLINASKTDLVLADALENAKLSVEVQSEHLDVIFLCRKSVLFCSVDPWIGKSRNNTFDVLQVSFHGVDVSELIDIYILSKMNELVHIDHNWLYRDDSLMCVSANTRANDIVIKKLLKIFKNLGFQITVEVNMKNMWM